MGIHWVQWFLRGEGVHKLKGRRGRQFSDLRGKENLAKKRGCSVPHFGRQSACHDITEWADSQTNKFFSYNDCMTVEILQKCLFIKQMTSDSGS